LKKKVLTKCHSEVSEIVDALSHKLGHFQNTSHLACEQAFPARMKSLLMRPLHKQIVVRKWPEIGKKSPA
jgi:hypothetical protein